MSRIYDNRLRLLQEAHETLITARTGLFFPAMGFSKDTNTRF